MGTRSRLELHRRVPAALDDEVHAEHHREDGKRRYQRVRSVVTFAASCSIVPRVATSIGKPRPTKDMVASAMMNAGNSSVAWVTI